VRSIPDKSYDCERLERIWSVMASGGEKLQQSDRYAAGLDSYDVLMAHLKRGQAERRSLDPKRHLRGLHLTSRTDHFGP